ncbi:MAG: hypothetical protein V1899_09590 [Planctomycetota bacterium]
MRGFASNWWVWSVAALIVVIGALFGVLRNPQKKPDRFAEPATSELVIVPKNDPVVTGFKGHLAEGGYQQKDGAVIPFVAGETLKLEAEVLNATESRWMVNSQVIKDDDDKEWSTALLRLYDVKNPGEYKFTVQVRGADTALQSLPKEKTLKIVPLFIESFEPELTEPDDEDRRLTGTEYGMEVTLIEPIAANVEFYKLRYLVNGHPTRHPDVEDADVEEGEWCHETDFRYTFPAPGTYSFRVEVRRATSKDVEGFKELESPIIVADAILSSFDIHPYKHATLGTTVDLSVFNESLSGKSDVRLGVKKITTTDFEWLKDEDGAIWGSSLRHWLPKEPGNYLIRAEVRESGQEQINDFKELRYTIVESDF